MLGQVIVFRINLDEKLLRSKSTERIDFSKYQSAGVVDPPVKVKSNGSLIVEPCWTVEDDWDGQHYKSYIVDHLSTMTFTSVLKWLLDCKLQPVH